MASNDDVPPLEDMSELIEQVEALRELKKSKENYGQVPVNGSQDGVTSAVKTPTEQKPRSQEVHTKQTPTVAPVSRNSVSKTQPNKPGNSTQKQQVFAGMKKGFLSGGTTKPKVDNKSIKTTKQTGTGANKTLEDIPFIKKQDNDGSERLQFSEVQEAMAKTTEQLMRNKEWVTDDLLTTIEKNETLSKRLQDPTFVQAIGEFQQNPQQALLKYQNNKEVQDFFKEFCGLMGSHFSQLGGDNPTPDTGTGPSRPQITAVDNSANADISVRSSTNPNQATAEDEQRIKQILNDPEIRVILMDPKIQDLFEFLKNDPAKGQRLLRNADIDLKKKIHKLTSVGLLQFQTG